MSALSEEHSTRFMPDGQLLERAGHRDFLREFPLVPQRPGYAPGGDLIGVLKFGRDELPITIIIHHSLREGIGIPEDHPFLVKVLDEVPDEDGRVGPGLQILGPPKPGIAFDAATAIAWPSGNDPEEFGVYPPPEWMERHWFHPEDDRWFHEENRYQNFEAYYDLKEVKALGFIQPDGTMIIPLNSADRNPPEA